MADTHSDPRAASVTTVDGPADLVGPAMIVDLVTIDGREIFLPRPLPGVTEYVSVARAEAEANELRPRLALELDETGKDKGYPPYQPNAGLVFGFHAAVGTTVTEAVVGIEAFANHHLARVVEMNPEKTLTYGGRTYSLPEARNIALNERIGYVLPDAIGRPRPTSEPWWPTFRRVQGLAALQRHGVSDPVERKGLDGDKTLVQRFVDREYRGAARMMLALFEFLSPGWIPPERMEMLPPPPE